MTEEEAREILQEAYGPRKANADGCFGDCCLRGDEKKALLTLIYGPDDE